jgi:alkylation response protein AidB-like acyl-CoA dehydrogenase
MQAVKLHIERVARELEPVIRAHAAEGERAGRLPLPIVGALHDAGVFRMMSPRSLNGGEQEPLAFFALVEALSRLDASTGWCAFIGGGAVTIGRFFPDEAAEEVFGDPGAIMGGSVFPPGRAVAADGGYVVSGRWAYASGCQHTRWLLAVCITHDREAPRLNGAGAPEMRAVLVPTADVRIIETWDVSGLRGTGSHDFALEQRFVSEKYTAVLGPGQTGRHYQGPLYRMPFYTVFGYAMAPVAIGAARGAIEACLEMAVAKVPRGSQTTLRERPLFQYQLADALATALSGRAWLWEEVGAAWGRALAGDPSSLEQRGQLSLAAAHAVRSAAHAVDIAYTAGGGTANYSASPLQRALRDVHAVTQHTAVAPSAIENAGRIMAGLPVANPMLLL